MVEKLLEIRSVIQTAIEAEVKARTFSKNNEAAVELTLPADHPCRAVLADREFTREFFIVSDLVVREGADLAATAALTPHPMCPRCRRYEPPASDEGLCPRCEGVLSAATS
ncbi:MAG: isoleucine--tRNA ligase, partial [Akkermansiaceae bacterium]|nr:isoleucine--tRNA ligase [Akkermansiaceae bacterium]